MVEEYENIAADKRNDSNIQSNVDRQFAADTEMEKSWSRKMIRNKT